VRQIKLAGFILAEAGNLEWCVKQELAFPEALRIAQSPNFAQAKVGVEIDALQGRVFTSPVDVPAGDGASFRLFDPVRIFQDGINKTGLLAALLLGVRKAIRQVSEALAAFQDIPAVVCPTGKASWLEIDFFTAVLSNIGDIQVAGETIKGEAPWVA
jgi:hypothetical protein